MFDKINNLDKNVLIDISNKLNIDALDLYKLIDHESRWDPFAQSTISSAKGLIQFIDSTAKDLGYENSNDLVLSNPTITMQLKGPVYNYLKKLMPFVDKYDLYLSVFYPGARGKGLDYVFPENVRKNNPGIITAKDYIRRVDNKKSILKPVIIVASILILYSLLTKD